jgi:hypothetical protein
MGYIMCSRGFDANKPQRSLQEKFNALLRLPHNGSMSLPARRKADQTHSFPGFFDIVASYP